MSAAQPVPVDPAAVDNAASARLLLRQQLQDASDRKKLEDDRKALEANLLAEKNEKMKFAKDYEDAMNRLKQLEDERELNREALNQYDQLCKQMDAQKEEQFNTELAPLAAQALTAASLAPELAAAATECGLAVYMSQKAEAQPLQQLIVASLKYGSSARSGMEAERIAKEAALARVAELETQLATKPVEPSQSSFDTDITRRWERKRPATEMTMTQVKTPSYNDSHSMVTAILNASQPKTYPHLMQSAPMQPLPQRAMITASAPSATSAVMQPSVAMASAQQQQPMSALPPAMSDHDAFWAEQNSRAIAAVLSATR